MKNAYVRVRVEVEKPEIEKRAERGEKHLLLLLLYLRRVSKGKTSFKPEHQSEAGTSGTGTGPGTPYAHVFHGP
jgi:hypothetical protein